MSNLQNDPSWLTPGVIPVTPVIDQSFTYNRGYLLHLVREKLHPKELARMKKHDDRVLREEIQRQAAKAERKLARAARSKLERELEVRSRRDKRSGVTESGVLDPEAQVGRLVLGASAVGVGWLFRSVSKLVGKVAGTCDAATNAFGTATAGFKGIVDGLKKRLVALKKKLSHPLFLTAVVLVLSFYILRITRHGSFPQRVLLCTLTFMAGPILWESIAKHFLQCDAAPADALGNDVQAQSGAGVMSAVLASTMCFTVFGAGMSHRTVSEAMKRVSLLERTTSGFELFCGWAVSAVESICTFFSQMFGGPAVRFRQETDVALKQWCRSVEQLEKTWNLNEKDVDAGELQKLSKLVIQGTELKELYRTRPVVFNAISAMLVRLYSLFAPYAGTVSARNNFRVEPEMLMLVGEPGIGKTVLMMPICAYVLKASGLLPPDADYDEVVSNIWQKGTSEYWNGYAGQKALVLDDSFQERPVAGDKDNEYINVIRMVGSWAMPLNFADLASKGKIYFNSPFIVGTTNLRSVYAPCSTVCFDPKAVVRRISSPYSLTLRPEFANSKGFLDVEKLAEQRALCKGKKGIEAFPFHMWEVSRHDFIAGTSSVVKENLSDVVKNIAEGIKKRLQSQVDAEAGLKDFIRDMDVSGEGSSSAQGGRTLSPLNQSERIARRTDSELRDVARALEEEQREYARLSSRFKRWFSVVGGFLREHGWKIALAAGVFKVLSVVISTVLDLLSPEDKARRDRLLSESNRPVSAGSGKGGAKVRFVSEVKPQGGNDPVVAKVYNNTCKMYVRADGRNIVLGQMTFVSSDMAYMPHHFRALLLDQTLAGVDSPLDREIVFVHALTGAELLVMPVSRFMALKSYARQDLDVEFVTLPLLNAPKNIIKNYLLEADLKNVPGLLCRLDVMEVDDRVGMLARPRHAIHTTKLGMSGRLRYEGYCLERHAHYAASTSAGDCGAPLSLEGAASYGGRKTFGMHVAGRDGRPEGFATIITQELLHEAMAALRTVYDASEEDIVAQCGADVSDALALPPGFGGTFLPVLTLPKLHQQPQSSKLFRTPLHGVFGEHAYYPSVMRPVLRDGVALNPMVNAVAPYSGPLRALDVDLMEQALHVAMKPHARETQYATRRLFSFEEAVLGVPQLKFRAIPRGTSAGFPYMYDLRGGKKEIFGCDELAYDLDTPLAQQLKEDVEEVIDAARQLERKGHVFVDLLKDELRKESKVLNAATRLISSSPVRYTVAFRQYFGAFCAATMANHTTTGMAPGINVYQDWHELARLLESKGDSVFAGDVKGLDSSEQVDLLLLILDYINRWYGDSEENQNIRRVLWMELYHSRHLGGTGLDQRHIYQWNKSLPSGHPMTTIVNSIYTLTSLVACYIRATGDRVGFWDNCFASVYGDDNVVNVSERIVPIFNQRVVAGHMWDALGIVYTPDDKEAELGEVTTLSKVTFLKRGFRLSEDGTWDAPLALDSFLFSCYWGRNKKLMDAIIVDELENALCELSLHSPELWDEWAPTVASVLAQYVGKFNTRNALTRKAYRAAVQARADAWF